jgi:hypothetical protein
MTTRPFVMTKGCAECRMPGDGSNEDEPRGVAINLTRPGLKPFRSFNKAPQRRRREKDARLESLR